MGRYYEVKNLDFQTIGEDNYTKTSHGIGILVNHIRVGRVEKFTPPPLDRKNTFLRELSPAGVDGGAYGVPVDLVPGPVSDGSYIVGFTRAEIWGKELEKALGFGATFANLTDQTKPFVLEEVLYMGKGLYETWLYTDCWFENISESERSSDGGADPTIRKDVKVNFLKRVKV